MLCQEGERGCSGLRVSIIRLHGCCAKKAKGASWLLFSTFLFPFLHLCAKIYNFPLEKALNEERRIAYEERMYFVVADKRD